LPNKEKNIYCVKQGAEASEGEDNGIPNFKNFLSLHIFVQSLAEQKHALKIPEHTLIIMCNNKAGYN
jgi:hypothetical protein